MEAFTQTMGVLCEAHAVPFADKCARRRQIYGFSSTRNGAKRKAKINRDCGVYPQRVACDQAQSSSRRQSVALRTQQPPWDNPPGDATSHGILPGKVRNGCGCTA